MANIVITGVTLSPNPVETQGLLQISVEITEKVYAILESGGDLILTADDVAIEYSK